MLIPCPVCNRQVSEQAPACPGCGTPIATAPAPPPTPPPAEAIPPTGSWPADPAPATVPPATTTVYAYTSKPGSGAGGARPAYSEVQPVWQYALLEFCTFGLYDWIWYYCTWRLLKERHRLQITPAARAIFRDLFAIHLCREVFKLSADAGYKPSWRPVSLGWSCIILDGLAGGFNNQKISVLVLVGVVFFVGSIWIRFPLVRALNDFWRQEQPQLPERTRLSGRAWVVVIFGSLFWIAGLLGIIAEQSGALK